jgi:hypothetical protein
MNFARRSLPRLLVMCVIGAGGAAAGLPAAARANLVSLTACNSSSLSQPFLPWGDPSFYELAPGGDFEAADYAVSPWTLTGGASLIPGSEPFAAGGTLGAQSLLLPAGAAAESPPTCVDAAYPTIRFFVGGTGAVRVAVVSDGVVIPVGVAGARGHWHPSAVMLTGSAVEGVLAGGTAQISLEFTAVGGEPQIDDVFIDPFFRG